MAKKTARRDYGSGSVYQRSSDGRWIGTIELGTKWSEAEGKYIRDRKPVSAKTKTEVIDKLRALDRHATATNVPRLDAWLREWLGKRRKAPKTIAADKSNIEKLIIPHLGRHKLDTLKPKHILDWHETLRQRPKVRGTGTMEESAILRAHAVLSKALEDAYRLERGWLPEGNPARRVDRPGKGHPNVKWLDVAQSSVFLKRVENDPLISRWTFGFLTGQRQGECLGLRRPLVDLDIGMADVSWQLQRLGYKHGCGDTRCGRRFAGDCPAGILDVDERTTEYIHLEGGLCLTRPKGGVVKAIPLAGPLVDRMRVHIESTAAGPHDLVWHRDGGRPLDPRQDYDAFIALLAECGLPRVKPHSMRHTCATVLLSLGVSEEIIRQLVGWNTLAAARSYLHRDMTASRAAAAKLAGALGLSDMPEIAT